MAEGDDAKETARTEAFSDSVFSIAITLLVLDITVPRLRDATPQDLALALRAEALPLAALTLSFATIFIMWVNHHQLFTRLHHIDGRIHASNGLLLLLVTVCPFPTSLVAEYLGKPGASVAAGVYAGYFVLVNLSFNLLIESAVRTRHRQQHGLDDARVARLRRDLRFGFVAYVIAALSAFVNAWISIGICTLLWFYWARELFPGRSTGPTAAA